MYAKITLIGTIQEIVLSKKQNGWIKIKITRPFPDDNHIIHVDYIWTKVWKEYFKSLNDYLFNGQLLLIEGRIESKVEEKLLQNYVFAERIEKLTHKV